VKRHDFEKLVLEALESLPPRFQERLDNVDVVVNDRASKEQLLANGLEDPLDLLGLYEGVPITERHGYNMVLPDKITIFQVPIEAICSHRDEMVREIRDTVVHEIAHHFGISDERLDEMGV